MARAVPGVLFVLSTVLLAMCATPAPLEYDQVYTFAGSGSTGPFGGGYADGTADQARFHDPMALALAADGTLYVSDTRNHRIRAVAPDGSVSTVAGSGPGGPEGGFADGPAASARFYEPEGLTVDRAGNIIVADTLNDRIRRISPDAYVSTVAGLGVASHYGTNALLVNGEIYVADWKNHRIRVIMRSMHAGAPYAGH